MSCQGIDGSLGSNWKISLVVPFYGNKFVWEVVVACNLSMIPFMSYYIFRLPSKWHWPTSLLTDVSKIQKVMITLEISTANSFTIFIETVEKSYNGHCKLFLPLTASQNIRKYSKCHMWTWLEFTSHHGMSSSK